MTIKSIEKKTPVPPQSIEKKTTSQMEKDCENTTRTELMKLGEQLFTKSKNEETDKLVEKKMIEFVKSINEFNMREFFVKFGLFDDEQKIAQLYYVIEQNSIACEAVKYQNHIINNLNKQVDTLQLDLNHNSEQIDTYIEEIEECEQEKVVQEIEFKKLSTSNTERIHNLRQKCIHKNKSIYIYKGLLICSIVFHIILNYLYNPSFFNDMVSCILNYDYYSLYQYVKKLYTI
jgi:hypothetical protein